MAANTYVALKSVTISGTSTNDVTITGIPQGYTDLVIVTNLNNIGNVAVLRGQFNGDTTTSYSSTSVHGSGSAAGSSRQSNVDAFYMTYQGHVDGTKSTGIYHVMNYSNSTTYKTVISRASSASFGVDATVSLWRKTDPITSIRIVNDRAEYWTAGSTINIYGIAAASQSAKATGGVIYSDDDYFYHVFTGTASFTPTQSLTTDVLAVAGGGGGGSRGGGGGGAGGVLLSTNQSMTTTTYTVTVGNGGAAGTSSGGQSGTVGGNSTVTGSGFTTLTAIGGGAGGGEGALGGTGGSGGGSGSGYSAAGGAGTSGQGYAGGKFATTYIIGGGGGGGGAGQVGEDFSAISTWGKGGNGSTAYSDWTNVTGMGQLVSGTYYIAGGGGGGAQGVATLNTGGYGGGGAGNYNSSTGTGSAGAINSGGGGGGGGANAGTGYAGAAGGSGFVIIRYPK